MEISITDAEDIKIVSFIGNLDTNTSPDAEIQLMKLIDENNLKLVIDLEKLDYISSAGLRVLLATTKKVKSVGGECHMCNLNSVVQEVFDMSGFSMIFKVFSSSDSALDAYSQ